MEKSIAIVKETRSGEMRVVMLPSEVRKFVENGYKVFVERGSGRHAGSPDEMYEAAGARIVDTKTAWTASPFVVKYKCPSVEETKYFSADSHVCAYYHAEGSLELSQTVARTKATAYSYELFQLDNGEFPLPVCDNEIAGKLAILEGAYHLLSHQGGSGKLLSDIPGADRPKVVVIGYGNVGGAAARMAAQLGCEVDVFGTDFYRLRRFEATVPPNVRCHINDPVKLTEKIREADLVVGAILISTYNTPTMISENLVKSMRPGSVIVDVTCGYGKGYLPTGTKFTSFAEPAYKVDGIQHIRIDALPATVPITASQGTSRIMAPYFMNLGSSIFEGKSDPISQRGMIISGGKFVHQLLIDTFALLKSA